MPVLIAGLLACGGREPELAAGRGQFRGAEVREPRPKPDFTLTATDGTPFNFRRATEGKLTLLFFGYTHCPDICPVHLANIGAVRKKLTPSERDRMTVVFVTVDPDRDSLPVIRRWLDNFDRDFVGLRGTLDQANAIQLGLDLPPTQIAVDTEGTVDVAHAAQVLVFAPDGKLRLVYPFGTRQDDWAHDLPLLLTGRWVEPAAGGASAIETGSETIRIGNLRIENARVPALRGVATVSAYFTVENGAAEDDWLVGIEAPGFAGSAMLHTQEVSTLGQVSMARLDSIRLPAQGRLVFAPGGNHVMLEQLLREPRTGDRIPLVLRFRRAGRVTVPALGVSPTDGLATPAAAPHSH
ncbi:MAG: SCO family protein [Gemmatimonadaceae bacterium]|nr:SCO family protein [Gemmatimonadaceae bacterium]